jgi:hypothetical protein
MTSERRQQPNNLLPPSQFIRLIKNLEKSQKLGSRLALINANESPPPPKNALPSLFHLIPTMYRQLPCEHKSVCSVNSLEFSLSKPCMIF